MTGTIFAVNTSDSDAVHNTGVSVSAGFSALRIWNKSRLRTAQNLPLGGTLLIPLGPEWDHDLDNGFRPSGLLRLSETTITQAQGLESLLQDVNLVPTGSDIADLPVYGEAPSATHSLTMYRGSRTGLVFSAGMSTWTWGLSNFVVAAEDSAVKQAMANIFADMDVANPLLPEGDLDDFSKSTDTMPPTTTVASSFSNGTWTFTGTASDNIGGKVAGIEISYDGGAKWKRAGLTSAPAQSVGWTYSVELPASPAPFVLTRTVDDSQNMEAVKAVLDPGPKTLYVYGGLANNNGVSADNNIVISKSGGIFTVTNPGYSATFSTNDVTNIIVSLALGQNSVTIVDSALAQANLLTIQSAAATVPGSVTIRGGIGKDTIDLDHIKIGTGLTLSGKTGADTVDLTMSVISSGGANIDLRLNGDSSDGSTLVGGTINVQHARITGALTVNTGVARDQIAIDDTMATGARQVNTRSGNDWIARGMAMGSTVTIQGGTGDDTYAYARTTLANDPISDTAGSDWLDFSAAPESLMTFTLPILYENIRGSVYGETINGNTWNNIIDGNGSEDGGFGEIDILNGLGGDDTFIRGAVDAMVEAWGGDGNDTMLATGGNGDFVFQGENGNDLLVVDGISNEFADLTFEGGAGNDILKVRNAIRQNETEKWTFNAGDSTTVGSDPNLNTNWLMVESGSVYIEASASSSGKLDTKVVGTANLLADYLRQNRLFVFEQGKVKIKPNGGDAGTSILDGYSYDLQAQFDLSDNDLIIRSTQDLMNQVYDSIVGAILDGQNGLDSDLITNWNGDGLVSSGARTRNLAEGFDLTGLGCIRNADMDTITGIEDSWYTSFGGLTVSEFDVLVKFTYTGDANMSGFVSFDDYVGMDNAFYGVIPNRGWVTGDINYDGAINFDDYSKVDQAYFFQGAPL